MAAEAEQVERTRRKTWSRAQSEVFVPYRAKRRSLFRATPWGRVWVLGDSKTAPCFQRAQSPKVIVTGCLDAVGLLGDEGAI